MKAIVLIPKMEELYEKSLYLRKVIGKRHIAGWGALFLLFPLLAAGQANPVQTIQKNPLSPIARHARVREAERLLSLGKAEIAAQNPDKAREYFDQAINHVLETPLNDPERDLIDRYIQNLAESIYALDLESLGAARDLDQIRFDKSPLDEIRELTFPVDPRLKSKVQQEVSATTSQLPLVVNETVLSFINYFAYGKGRRTLEYALKRSGRYRPMIFRILAEEGVPQELIYLAQAESGFLPRAVSYKSAVGMWQFIKDTGRLYGLAQTSFTDDRLDPERATRAAARHLRDLYEELGDWHLALAAYNCGTGCVERAVQKTAYADYWELRNRRAIPVETTNYVPIILALTIIMMNPADYGLGELEMDPPLDYDTIEVPVNTSLELAADAAQVPVTQLEEMNPAVLHKTIPAGYFLRVPKGTKTDVEQAIAFVPPEKRDAWRLHRVQPGDSAETISKQYGLPANLLAQANPDFANAAFAVVPRMAKPKPALVARTRVPAHRTTATRTAAPPVRAGTAKKPAVKPSGAKPKAATKTPVRPSAPSAKKTAPKK